MDDTSRDAELENYLDALNDFTKKPSKSIPTVLEQLIQRIARHGEPLFPWHQLKPLIVMKLENVIEEYIEYNPHEEVPILPNVENVRFDDMRERLLRALESFNSAPFTIQRLCELLTEPKRYYRRSDKFMRGIEKNVQVVSTVTPSGKRITSIFDLQKSPPLLNGIVPEKDSPPTTDSDGFVRPDSDAFSIPSSSSSSSSSSRVDSFNGVGRPYYNSDAMDAPLQFAYPLGQPLASTVTSTPSSESPLRTDANRINGNHSEPHEADAKETSEAMPGDTRVSELPESRTSEDRTLGEEGGDVDTASVVSSSDTESNSGDGQKKEGEEEEEDMEVDVASSEDVSPERDAETTDRGTDGPDGAKNGHVSTSASSSSSSEDKPVPQEEAGKADSSQGSESTSAMECEEGLSTNSEAASRASEEGQEQEQEAEGVSMQGEGEGAAAGEPEVSEGASVTGAAGDAGPAGPADSSNDAQTAVRDSADESTSGSSEAASKASSPETAAPVSHEDPASTEDAVESSADARTSDQTDHPTPATPNDEVTDSTPSAPPAPQEGDTAHPSTTPDEPSGSSAAPVEGSSEPVEGSVAPEEGGEPSPQPEIEGSESTQS